MRRLDAALSKDPLKFCDATENASGSRTQSAEENFSRKVRKEMEGGNGATIGSGITHSPIGEQNVEKCAFQIDAAENLPRMDSALGVLLDGVAVKEKRKPSKISFAELPDRPAGSRLYQPPKKNLSRKVRKETIGTNALMNVLLLFDLVLDKIIF